VPDCPTVGSLFAGIGGIDLGLERAGFEIAWHSEIEPYACKVLRKHWPHVPNLGDVKQINWEEVPRVDVLAGGYPCQPFSLASAGARQGTDDPRHLWPYFADAIRVLRPRGVMLENVPGHLGLGFGNVIGDLASLGYDTEWDCIPAAALGASHRRDRVFVIAYPNCNSQHVRPVNGKASSTPESVGWPAPARAWASEPGVGRMAHGIPSQMDRLRGLGNAVVPQVAEHVGRILMQILNNTLEER
jgi:DNA (cytosine-5)-methyltransferase 1